MLKNTLTDYHSGIFQTYLTGTVKGQLLEEYPNIKKGHVRYIPMALGLPMDESTILIWVLVNKLKVR